MFYSLPYIIVFSIYVFFSLARNGIKNKQMVLFFIFSSFFLLFLFIGLKGYIYGDWIIYKQMFSEAPSLFESAGRIKSFLHYEHFSSIEHGFLLWMIICKTITNNYLLFQSISFIIDYIIIVYLLREYLGEYWIIGVCFYYLFGLLSMEVVYLRNIKALLLFIYSIRYINNNFLKYVLINILACFFHLSSIIYFPLYFILSKKWNRKLLLGIFIIGNILYLGQISITRNIFVFIAKMINIPKLDFYLESGYGKSNGITIGFLERFFTFILFYKMYPKVNIRDKDILFNCGYIYMILNFIFFDFYIISGRFGSIFVFSYWFLFPAIYKTINNKENKYLFFLILLFYGILKIYANTNRPWCMYNNILNEIDVNTFLRYVKQSS